VRSLAGSDAALFIAEMMGTDSYQLSPGKSVLFRAGKISAATDAPAECGCPELKPSTALEAAMTPAAAPANATQSAFQNVDQKLDRSADQNAIQSAIPAHLEVNGSFVYRGDAAVQDYYSSVSRLSLSTDNSKLTLALLPQVKGPAAESKPTPKKAGVLHRIGNFFGHLFAK
jgi:hypothetical protein